MAALLHYHDLRSWLPVNVLLGRIIRERRVVELAAVHRRPREHWGGSGSWPTRPAPISTAANPGSPGSAGHVSRSTAPADAMETVTPERDDDASRSSPSSAKGLEFPLVVHTGLNTQGRVTSDVIWQPRGARPLSGYARDSKPPDSTAPRKRTGSRGTGKAVGWRMSA